jgi:DNA polymerase IV
MDRATILHADLDAFYASVEQLLDPTLLGKPIAVGGGVVLAASYEAKARGVQGGMPGWRARKLCPGLQFVGGHFSEYQRLGDEVMGVLHGFTPLVERVSIDEAFLDVAGAVHLFGAPAEIAEQVRRRVREEIGLPISVGVATTKHLAKVASQVAKPDGLVVVEAGHEREFLDPLPVGLLWGVGPVTRGRLAAEGIHTIGQLAASDPSALQGLLGQATGTKLSSLAANADPRDVETTRSASSMGAQSAFGRRRVSEQVLRDELGFLADRVASRLRAKGRAGRTITVRVRFPGLRSVTRAKTLPDGIATTRSLADISLALARKALDENPREREINLLAISVSKLADQEMVLEDTPLHALDQAADAVRAKFGRQAVGHASVMFRDGDRVPDEFRSLAEADEGSRRVDQP